MTTATYPRSLLTLTVTFPSDIWNVCQVSTWWNTT